MARADEAVNGQPVESPATLPLTDVFRALVGATHAREATDSDAVDGVPPRIVVEPGSVEDISHVLRVANERGLAVVPRGDGTALGLGNPPERVDVIVSTTRLNRILEYSPGDLVVRAEAGLALGPVWEAPRTGETSPSLQREVVRAGQILALDPPGAAGATLGGVVARNASGPWRARYGTVRDLLIGITVVLADGTIARAGGKVVKNVAGYDLAKLYTGSLGTLGVIAETTWRLHPRPTAARVLTVRLQSLEHVVDLAAELTAPALDPSGMLVRCSSASADADLHVLLEGVERGVEARLAAARAMAGAHGDVTTDLPVEEWTHASDADPADADPAQVELKLTSPPSALVTVLAALLDSAAAHAFEVRIAGQPLVGVAHATIAGGTDAAYADAIHRLRQIAAIQGGSVIVTRAPVGTKQLVDVWGPVGNALPLMRRVKERFDPKRTLSPGRFVGGI